MFFFNVLCTKFAQRVVLNRLRCGCLPVFAQLTAVFRPYEIDPSVGPVLNPVLLGSKINLILHVSAPRFQPPFGGHFSNRVISLRTGWGSGWLEFSFQI